MVICRESWHETKDKFEKLAFSEIRLFLESHSLEFHEIWHENTLGIQQLEYWKIKQNREKFRYSSEPSTTDKLRSFC